MPDLKISIITVCLNADRFIEDAVKSVVSQRYPDIEYIVVDGGSLDGTLNVIGKYQTRIDKVISEKDKGIYDAMNKGLRQAAGPVVYFLNADDRLFDEDTVAAVMSKFKEDPGLALLFGNVLYSGGTEPPFVRRFAHLNRLNLIHEDLCHQGVFARKDLFDKTGGFDTSYKIAADYDWLLKIFRDRSHKIEYLDRTVAIFNSLGAHQQSGATTTEERLKIKLKYYGRCRYELENFIYRLLRKAVKSGMGAFKK